MRYPPSLQQTKKQTSLPDMQHRAPSLFSSTSHNTPDSYSSLASDSSSPRPQAPHTPPTASSAPHTTACRPRPRPAAASTTGVGCGVGASGGGHQTATAGGCAGCSSARAPRPPGRRTTLVDPCPVPARPSCCRPREISRSTRSGGDRRWCR